MAERERESLLCLCLVKMETFISSCALPCTSKFSRIAQMESETRFYTYVRVLRESRVPWLCGWRGWRWNMAGLWRWEAPDWQILCFVLIPFPRLTLTSFSTYVRTGLKALNTRAARRRRRASTKHVNYS